MDMTDSDDHPTEPDLDEIAAAGDRLAADLFWETTPTWTTGLRGDIETLARQLVVEDREPTTAEMNLLVRHCRRTNTETGRMEVWLAERRAIEAFDFDSSDLIAQIKFVRLTDIVAAVLATCAVLAILNGLGQLGRAILALIAGWN